MLSGAVSIFFFAAFAARISHACMAMQPNPRRTTTTTSAPQTTTTAATTSLATTTSTTSSTSSTTSSTTTTTTTTTAISCLSCTAPKYMAPMPCAPEFICDNAALLTTVQTPCVGATCATGSTLMGVQAGMPEVAISAMGIKCRQDGLTFEDAADPTMSFPAATSTFYCKKLGCMIPMPSAMCTPADIGEGTFELVEMC